MKTPSSKTKSHPLQTTNSSSALNNNNNKASTNISDLRQNPDLGYRIRVLLYDLHNVRAAPSESRLASTTHPLYVSEPYFRDHEASTILSAAVSIDDNDDDDNDDNDNDNSNTSPATPSPTVATQTQQTTTIEQALHARLETFLDKRRASGDARPCGPHDMVPIYSRVFGITKEELGDERFVGRLRRCGIRGSSEKEARGSEAGKKMGKKGRK